MAKRCAEVFMVSVTPQKRSKTNDDKADCEEEILLTLAPFQPQPKLIYNDVKVGTAKSCNFTVLNPTKKSIEIEFELPNDENLSKSDSGSWKWSQTRLIVGPGQSEVINVIWTPSKAGSHHFSVPVKQICNGNPRKLSNISISSTCVDNSKQLKQLKVKNKKPNCRPLQEKNVYVKSKNTQQQKQVITVTTPKTKEVKKISPATYTKTKTVIDVKLNDTAPRTLYMNTEIGSPKTPKNSNKTTILDHEQNDILPKDSIETIECIKKTSPDLTYNVGPLDNSGIPDIPENYERDSLDGSLLSTNSFTDFEKQLNDINLVSTSDGDDCLIMPFRSSVYETNKKESSLKNLAAVKSGMALNKKFDNITFSVEKVDVRKRRSTIIEVEENETTIINSETFISITNNTYCLKTPDKTFDVTNLHTNINSETFISIDPSVPLPTENVEVKKDKEVPCFLWKVSPPKRMRNEIKSDSPVVLPTASKVSMAKNRMGPPLTNNVISKRITRSISQNSLTSSDNNVKNKSRFSFNSSTRTSSVGTPNASSKLSTDPRLVKSAMKARRPSTTFTIPKARLKLVSSSMNDLSDGKNDSKQPGKSDSANDNSFTDSIIPKLSSFSKNPFCKELFYFLDVKTIDDAEKNLLKWVNAMLSPPIELEAVCTMPSQKQIISYSRSCIREYPARLVKEHRLKVVRRAASVLLQSDEITTVLQKLHVAIDRGAVAIRDDCDLHLDVGLQEIVLKLLLCYHPLWLRVALETVYKQNIPLNSNSDVAGLVNFIRKHLISDDYLKKKYAHPTVPFRMMPDFEKNMKKFILNKFLVIIYFLDIAKQNKLIRHDPCLFCKDSAFKTNQDVLQEFYKKFVKGGCNSKYLTTLGYKLQHKQTYLDEFDLKLNNRNDLRDGIRLTRLMEIILNNEKGTLYSQLRAPALSGFQKNHNVKLALNAFRNAGYVIENGTTEKDIINGHREKILSFLWQLRGTTFNAAVIIIQKFWIQNRDMIRQRMEFIKMRKSACKIQNWYRVKRAAINSDREKFVKLKSTVIFVQRCFRKKLAERKLKEDLNKKAIAAIIIQRYYRSYLKMKKVRNEFLQMKSVVLFMQQRYREIVNKRKEREFYNRFIKPVRIIQQWWRSIIAMRKDRNRFKKLKSSVLFVEEIRKSNLLVREIRSNFLTLKFAAVTLQSRWRAMKIMKLERSKYMKLKSAVSFIDTKRKANLISKKIHSDFLKMKNATITLQRWWKSILIMRKYRLAFSKLKYAVSLIEQRRVANLLSKKQHSEFLKLKSASLTIQRRWRAKQLMKIDLNAFLKLKWAVSVVGQKRRTNLKIRNEMSDFTTLKISAVIIQRWWRNILIMKKERIRYKILKSTVIFVEEKRKAKLLMVKEKSNFDNLKNATIKIQQKWKSTMIMKQDRNTFTKMKWAVSFVEEKRRTILITRQKQADFITLKTATVTIQKWWRSIIAMKNKNYYLKLKWAVSVIEEKRRINLITRKQQFDFKRLKMAAINIQKWWRTVMIMKKERNQYILLKATVLHIEQKRIATLKTRQEQLKYKIIICKIIKIQRWWRRILNMKKQKEFLNQQRVSALEDEEKKTKEDAVIKLQKAVRNWLSNQRNKKNREHAAAIMIQAFWKGYRVRKEHNIDTRKLSVLKLPETKTLRELKTGLVLNLAKVNSMHVLITYLQRLEMITSFSTELSGELVEEGVVEVLYNWLNKLTRGVSDQSAAFFVVAVLVNLVKFRNTADSTWTITCNKKGDKGYETILTYCVHSFKSKQDLFCCCVTLLWLWSHDPEKLKVMSGAKNLNYVVKTINREIPANNKPNKKVNAVKIKKLLPSKAPNWGLQNTKLGPEIFNDSTFAWQTLLKQFKL